MIDSRYGTNRTNAQVRAPSRRRRCTAPRNCGSSHGALHRRVDELRRSAAIAARDNARRSEPPGAISTSPRSGARRSGRTRPRATADPAVPVVELPRRVRRGRVIAQGPACWSPGDPRIKRGGHGLPPSAPTAERLTKITLVYGDLVQLPSDAVVAFGRQTETEPLGTAKSAFPGVAGDPVSELVS